MREIDIEKYEEVLNVTVSKLEKYLKEKGLDNLDLNRIEVDTMKNYNFVGSGEIYIDVTTSRDPDNMELITAVNNEIENFLDFYLDVIVKVPDVKYVVKKYVILKRLQETINYYFKDILGYKFIDTDTKIFIAESVPARYIRYDFKTLEYPVAIVKPKEGESISVEVEEVVVFDLNKMILRTL